jgi:hypothetical protein
VFGDRYHDRILKSPMSVRHCISCVLNNWRKHGEDELRFAREWLVDPFSSAVSFRGWKELDGVPWTPPPTYEPLVVWEPRTWLLEKGWLAHGPISVFEVPSKRV